jgi:hypothetical protein
MNLYELFAEILDYPNAQQAVCIQDCDARLTRESPESAELLQRFQARRVSVWVDCRKPTPVFLICSRSAP